MQLPVDVKALLDETSNIKTAHDTEIAVSVYIDETAPADVAAHVRNAFASSLPTVRMTLNYLGAGFVPQPTDDVAVIVAGKSNDVGKCDADLRAVGVPVMVVAADGAAVGARAEQAGHPIPHGDLIALDEGAAPDSDAQTQAEAVADQAARGVAADQWDPNATSAMAGRHAAADRSQEKTSVWKFGPDQQRDLDTRMGRWIVSVCRDKRLAYAMAFPFVRRPLARDAVQTTALQNAAVGLVPFLPGADLPIMTLNQAKMVLQIGAAYGQEMTMARLKEVAAVAAAAYLSRGLARRLVAAVPVVGFAVKAGVAYGLTAAMGYGVIEYFEGGRNVTGVANVIERATTTGTKALGAMRKTAAKYLPMVTGGSSK